MDENQEEVKPQKGGSNIILIIIIVILIVFLLGGGLLVYFLMSGNDESSIEQAEQQVAQMSKKGPTPRERSNDFFNVGPMYPLDQFVVNLLSESGSRYLKMELNLELSSELLTVEIDQKKPLIRDIIIRTLTSKTYEDVSTAKGKERLKDEIVGKLNEIIRDGYIKNVFFTDFIVQ